MIEGALRVLWRKVGMEIVGMQRWELEENIREVGLMSKVIKGFGLMLEKGCG